LTVNLLDVKAVGGKGSYPLMGLDPILKDTCCNMAATLGELYKHVGGSKDSDFEISIGNLGQKTAVLILLEMDASFSLAFEVPTDESAFMVQGLGQKPVSIKKPDSKRSRKN